MNPQEIEQLIRTALPGCHVQVRDTTGGGDHFEGVVVSEKFEGLGLVAQHQLVYGALGSAMHTTIHAFSFKTFTPQAWTAARARA